MNAKEILFEEVGAKIGDTIQFNLGDNFLERVIVTVQPPLDGSGDSREINLYLRNSETNRLKMHSSKLIFPSLKKRIEQEKKDALDLEQFNFDLISLAPVMSK